MSVRKKKIKKSFDDFNASLKAKVNNVRESVKIETERLKELSHRQSQDLTETEQKITETLSGLKVSVDCKIDAQMSKLITNIRDKVSVVLSELNKVNKDLINYVNDLYKWVEAAEKVLNAALAKVQIILNEVKVGASDKKPDEIMRAIDQIGRDVMMIYEAGNEAKQRVQTEVKAALGKVKEMDTALKKDLFTAKKKIKAAVVALGKTLDKNVRDGLWTIEEAIRTPVESLVGGTRSFDEAFKKTKGVIQSAVNQVHEDILKLWSLQQLEKIEGKHTVVSAPLLKAIGEGKKSFEPFTKYFNQLDTAIISKVKTAIEKIGEGMKIIGPPTGIYNLSHVLKNAENALQDVASATVPEINELKTLHGMSISVEKLNLKTTLTKHAELISTIKDKIKNGNGHLQAEEATKLLSTLGDISKAVSNHSQKVVQEVINKITQKVTDDIGEVADVIKNKIDDCSQLVTDRSGKFMLNQFKDFQGITGPFSGLQALVNTFDGNIMRPLVELNNVTISNAFKQTGTGQRPQDKYEFGDSFMTAFHDTYEKNLKNGDIKTSGGTSEKNVLDEEIGTDPLAGDKISALGEKCFDEYRLHVSQTDDLVLASDDPEPLKGALPSKIKDIRQQVQNALEHIDEYNTFINKQFEDIKLNFNALCNDVTQAAGDGEGVKGRLQELQNKYFLKVNDYSNNAKQSVRKIHYDLSTLQGKLEDGPIKKTKNVLEFLTKAERQFPELLKQEIQKDVKDATTSLTIHARKQYVKSIKFMLEKFAEKLRSNLAELPTQIAADLEQGHKKFMKLFDTIIVKQVTEIPRVNTKHKGIKESPLNKAANIFKTGLTIFFKTLKELPDFKSDFNFIRPSYSALLKLLTGIISSLHFDDDFRVDLEALRVQVTQFHPAKFGEGHNDFILEALKRAFSNFAKELDKAYVSRYSLQKITDSLTTQSTDKEPKDIVTEYGRKCAKVCLTIVPMLTDGLKELKDRLEDDGWKTYNMYDARYPRAGLYGAFFRSNGYDPCLSDKTVYGGLNHKTEFTGAKIYEHLTNKAHKLFTAIQSADPPSLGLAAGGPTIDVVDENGVVSQLHGYLKLYFNVCHFTHIAKPKSPCSVYEMLLWCSGLQFNAVYGKLAKHCDSLFEKKNDEHDVEKKIPVPIPANPTSITLNAVDAAIDHISSHAYLLLTGILGTGDALTVYASDFCTNHLQLSYPSNPSQCLDMLIDLMRRLFPSLKYLQSQCALSTKHGGWKRCEYGSAIKTGKWPCKNHSSDRATCQPNCEANDQPKCQPASPLMSCLTDCLPGHLPHQLVEVGCKAECKTCPNNKRGMPCLTPFGFRAFSGSTHTGEYLCELLAKFFDDAYLTSLFGLAPRPPATLPEHFGFALSLAHNLNTGTTTKGQVDTLSDAFESRVTSQSIKLYKDAHELTDSIVKAYGSDAVKHNECEDYHLRNLTTDAMCKNRKQTANNIMCVPYLTSLCNYNYEVVANKHADLYLSWAVYLPWTFWSYLESLYSEFTNILCQDWGCHSCLRGDGCKAGSHGMLNPNVPGDGCQCRSVVECNGVSPTLYKYGFAFSDSARLSAKEESKTCFDFQVALHKVLYSQYFKDLFTECDKYLWIIREPFSYLVLALWLLSLLYLLHIMVIRLDLLHIKSHLHSPSSHRIAAQSLLAAGRVNKLNRVFYLQP